MQRFAPLCILAAAVLAGCGMGHRQTITTSNGAETVTTSGDNKTVTVNGSQGSATVGAGAIDISKLGAPVYPGATQDQNGGISMSNDKGTSETAVFKTPDDFSKVESYYKSQLPAGSEKMNMATSGGSLATFEIGDENSAEQTTVTVTSKPGDPTSILLSHVVKSGAGAATVASPNTGAMAPNANASAAPAMEASGVPAIATATP